MMAILCYLTYNQEDTPLMYLLGYHPASIHNMMAISGKDNVLVFKLEEKLITLRILLLQPIITNLMQLMNLHLQVHGHLL